MRLRQHDGCYGVGFVSKAAYTILRLSQTSNGEGTISAFHGENSSVFGVA
jgi:hypothetical protein